jgi:hypothetical protein
MGNGSASHSPVSNGALTGLEELVDVKLSELGKVGLRVPARPVRGARGQCGIRR